MSPTRRQKSPAHELQARLRGELERQQDPARARKMQAYMKSTLPYWGLPMAKARSTFRELTRGLTFASLADLEQWVRVLYGEATHREERYAALYLLTLRAAKPLLTAEALPLMEWLIVEGSWWDLVDDVANHHLCDLLDREPRATSALLRRWSRGDHLWLRRAAIVAQVLRHERTDTTLLFEVMLPAIEEKEFFLRKGIGWALRVAAREFPSEVRSFLEEHHETLSGLSRREAEKGFRPSRR